MYRCEKDRWSQCFSQLMTNFSSSGFVLKPAGSDRFELRVPGLDIHLPFQMEFFWDRARLFVNRETNTVSYEWIYWTPLQTALHFLITLSFLLTRTPVTPSWFLALTLSNLIPLALSLGAARSVGRILRASGFKKDQAAFWWTY